jgi:hypothetical protein
VPIDVPTPFLTSVSAPLSFLKNVEQLVLTTCADIVGPVGREVHKSNLKKVIF